MKPQDIISKPPRYLLNRKPVLAKGSIQKVRVYPSGIIPSDVALMGAWVKMKKVPDYTRGIHIIESTLQWIHVDTPDRELLMVRNAIDMDQDRPLLPSGKGWDYFFSLSTTHSMGESRPTDRFMINPSRLMNIDRESLKLRTKNKQGSTQQMVLSDSTGFQLLSGAVDFIDPMYLSEFYNENVDEGEVLDIPSGYLPEELIRKCAEIQAKNSMLMQDNVQKHVTLSNIVSGVEIPEMKTYIDVISKKDKNYGNYEIVSFPSSMGLNPLKQLDRLAFLVSQEPSYSQYHMLGLSALTSMIVCTRFVHKLSEAGRDIFVTVDATSAYELSNSRRYLLWTNPNELPKDIPYGLSSPAANSISSAHSVYACQCPSCTSLKYTDTQSLITGLVAPRFLARHNEDIFAEWLNLLNDYCANLDDEEFKQWAMFICPNIHKQNLLDCLDYISLILDKGWKVAHKKYKHKTHSLFEAPATDMWGNPIKQEVTENRQTKLERVKKVIDRYTFYHKKGKLPNF